MTNNVIDLSWRRKRETLWLGTHSIDSKLLSQCAYYPRPPGFESNVSPCVKCSIEKPPKTCKYSHILTFTKADEKPKSIRSNAERLFKGLSVDDREALIRFLASRRRS